MELRGEYRFPAPRETVYAMLLDSEIVRAAMPGCERFEPVGPDAYDVTLRVGMAALKGEYRGRVQVVQQLPPEAYQLEMTGTGGPGGVTGRADLRLEPAGTDTVLRYRGDITARGALASLGIQMLGGSAKILIGQFMKGMEREIRLRTV